MLSCIQKKKKKAKGLDFRLIYFWLVIIIPAGTHEPSFSITRKTRGRFPWNVISQGPILPSVAVNLRKIYDGAMSTFTPLKGAFVQDLRFSFFFWIYSI